MKSSPQQKSIKMIKAKIIRILNLTFPSELTTSCLESFTAMLREYKKENWKYAGNESGQFIEVARRMIEFVTAAKYTPLSEQLPLFNENTIKLYEQNNVTVDTSYRILIPRYLFAMYSVRNKRGIIHKSNINPNYMDSTLLLNSAKWILAEFVRLSSNLPFEETTELIESLTEKEQSLFWNVENSTRILCPKMASSTKILCLLYYKDGQTDTQLQTSIEYKNSTSFKSILKDLHKERKIEYINGNCFLSPVGLKEAEETIRIYNSHLI